MPPATKATAFASSDAFRRHRQGVLHVGWPSGGRTYRSLRDGAGERRQIDHPKAQVWFLLLPTLICSVALAASITRAGIWREVLAFVRLPLPVLRVGRRRFFHRNVGPDFREFGIQPQPFL
jgi:hypothetical protein